jgi:hypothetical protein
LEEVECDSVNEREVLGSVGRAFAVQVFAEADIERPVQLILDSPVLTNRTVQPLGLRLEAGDVEVSSRSVLPVVL